MTIVYNVVNILQDYLYINQWHWASTGAGMSAGISQYLMLLTGLIFLLRDVPLKEVAALKEQILESSGFKSIARLTFLISTLLTLPGLKTRGFHREFQSISLSYPSFRHGSLNIWVLALILFAITGRIISDKRNFPRVPR